jgi:hypothetical protein
MKWALIIAGVLAGIAAIVVIIGALLPKGHVTTRAARFRQTPAAIWQTITDVEKFPSWRAGVTSVEKLPDRDEHLAWMERGAHDSIPYELVESVAPSGNSAGRLVTRIADPKLPFGGTWTLEIAAADGGTMLRITERGEVYNPVFRFMSRFVFGQTKTMEDYLSALGKKFGETVSIQE